jgi:hypothetical protein
MGGAAIARGNDSAMPTINPAGLALIPTSTVSISASLYSLRKTSVPHYVADGGLVASESWGELALQSPPGAESTAFTSLPSGLAYFLHLGDEGSPTVLGASLSVPRSVSYDFVVNVRASGDNSQHARNEGHRLRDQQYAAALSWASAFGRLRLGASFLLSLYDGAASSDGTNLVWKPLAGADEHNLGSASYSNAYVARSLDLTGLVGAQLDVSEDLCVGVALRLPSAHAWGAYEGSQSVHAQFGRNDANPVSNPVLVQSEALEGDLSQSLPLRLGVGVQLRQARWAVALDATLYLPRSDEFEIRQKVTTVEPGKDPVQQESVLPSLAEVAYALALGFEHSVGASRWIRTGAFVVQSAERERATAELLTFAAPHVGGSLGYGSRIGPVDTTVGVIGSYAAGKTPRIVPGHTFGRTMGREPELELTTFTQLEVMFFLSAAVDVSFERAYKRVEELDAQRPPALIPSLAPPP